MHDPRIGRFFAVDPLAPEYPHNSPYAFSENSVIAFVELEGLERARFRVGVTRTYTKVTTGVKVYSNVQYIFSNAMLGYVYNVNGVKTVEKDWQTPGAFETHFEDEGFNVFGGFTWTFYESRTDAQNGNNGTVTTWEKAYLMKPQKLWVKYNSGGVNKISEFEHYITFNDFYVQYGTNEFGNSQFTMGPDINTYIDKSINGLIYFPEFTVEIVGNTSHSGTTTYNQALSESRAQDMYCEYESRLFTLLGDGTITQEQYDSALGRISITPQGETNATGGADSDNAVDRNVQIKHGYK